MPATERSRSRQTVLVVDDEPVIVRLLDAILRRNRFDVITASTGEQALEEFRDRSTKICLLIVDITLTGPMSGFEFVDHLPTLRPRIPVLFTTRLGELEIECKVPPNCDLLQKPFTPEQLMHWVNVAVSLGQPPSWPAE